MIRVNDNAGLLSLTLDVHNVLCEASKEFENVQFFYEFDSKRTKVKCVRFQFWCRRRYYQSVYPYCVELFNYLDRAKCNVFNGFTYIRHSVSVDRINGVKKYSLVLWY